MNAAPVFRLLCALLLCFPVTPLALPKATLPPAGALAFGPAPETLAAPGDSGGELHTVDTGHEADARAVTGPLPSITSELTPELLAGVLEAHQGGGLLVTEPRRGPPACGPETRIGAFEVPGASLIGAETFSNPHAQRGQRVSWLEIAEGEHPAVWVHNAVVTGLRKVGNLKKILVTGATKGGMKRASSAWRRRFGPASMRRHHLLPQEFLNDPTFRQRMSVLGFGTEAKRKRFVDKFMADIADFEHKRIHAEGWNEAWHAWLTQNPSFLLGDVYDQMRSMRKEFELPVGVLGGRRYGRK